MSVFLSESAVTARSETVLESAEGRLVVEAGIPVSFAAGRDTGTQRGKPEGKRHSGELQFLLDRKHLQRWGKKVFHRDIDVELRPFLERTRLFQVRDGRLAWLFHEDPVFKKMEEDFGSATKRSHACYGPDPCFVEAWRWRYAREAGILPITLLYLCHNDHEIYARFPGHPNDALGYMNADRFFFVCLPEGKETPTEDLLETVGRMHLHIHEVSGMLIPGFAERDCLGLPSIFNLIFVSETEHQAKMAARRLKLFGRGLTLPSKTLEVRSLSWEALDAFPNRENDICDLLNKISTRIG